MAANKEQKLMGFSLKTAIQEVLGEMNPQTAGNMLSVNEPLCYHHSQDSRLTV